MPGDQGYSEPTNKIGHGTGDDNDDELFHILSRISAQQYY